MRPWERFTFRRMLATLSAVYVGGLLTVFLLTFLPLHAVRIHGPLYDRLLAGHALADGVSPPPLLLLESLMTLEQLGREYDDAKRTELLGRLASQRAAYDRALRGQLAAVPADDPARAPLAASAQDVAAFFDAVEKELRPALFDGDALRSLAALERAKAAFERHRARNAEVAAALGARLAAEEEATAARVRWLTAGIVALVLALVAVSGAVSWVVARRIGRGLALVAAETGRVTRAIAEEGRLDVRGDPGLLVPEFRPVLAQLNATVDAVARPLQVTREALDRVSRGDLPGPLAEEFKGELDEIRRSLNRSIEAVGRLAADASGLAAAALEGRLDVRADAAAHQGDFRRVVEGINQTLEAVVVPQQAALAALARLADHDLGARVHGEFSGDHAALQRAVNGTAQALGDAIVPVAGATRQLSQIAAQLGASSLELSAGASSQSTSLAEAGRTAGALAEGSRRSGAEAERADGLAHAARAQAAQGEQAMARMQDAMARIRGAAEGTSQIIRDINEIALQTNLLALNAAVEAARAGQAGRSFAVVAEEVRSLALRSKAAASRTEQLIRDSVREAEHGASTAHGVAAQLGEIVTGVTQVSEIVTRIAADNREQVQRVGELEAALSEASRVASAHGAVSEASTSAAERLEREARELARLVEAFQVEAGREAGPGDAERGRPPPEAPRPAPRAVQPRVGPRRGDAGRPALHAPCRA